MRLLDAGYVITADVELIRIEQNDQALGSALAGAGGKGDPTTNAWGLTGGRIGWCACPFTAI